MHGSKHRQPHNALSFEVTKNLVHFIFSCAEKNALLLPGKCPAGFHPGGGWGNWGAPDPLKPSKEHIAKRARARVRAWARAWDRARVARTVTESVSLGEISLWEWTKPMFWTIVFFPVKWLGKGSGSRLAEPPSWKIPDETCNHLFS